MSRVLSALFLGALVIYVIAAAPFFLGAVLVLAVTLIAAHETAALLEAGGGVLLRVPGVAATCLTVAGAWASGPSGLAAGLTAGLLLYLTWMVLTAKVEGSVARFSGGAFLLLYPVWSLSHFLFYLDSQPGRRALLFVLGCVWVCDSAAYYAGSTLGRRKLAPRVSPNKTIAGAVGGIMGGAGAAVVLAFSGLVPWPMASALGAGLLTAVLAQAGDLAESMIKRDAGVKDSGSLIPGHGGMMDRVDALLFAVPAFYYILAGTGGLG